MRPLSASKGSGQRVHGFGSKKDAWRWKATKGGDFSTKSAYDIVKAAKTRNINSNPTSEILKEVWNTPATHKAKVTTWRLVRNRLPTCDNLRRRNIQIGVEESWCNACCHRSETCKHLFIECPKADAVWSGIQQWLGINGPRPNDITEHLEAFTNLGKKKHRKTLRALWMCITWLMWKNRNESRFDGKTWDVQALIREIKVMFWCWIKIFKLSNADVSFSSWMSQIFDLHAL
ncbi:uncharacterized protein LOC131011143 [Salvia miltiorrhiza]|uniref:uncharacterized protein LOC131011143 n=1 Tax=Salvia miltiorrhiza TaxID=226208 RepID=UPI0025ACBA47|nr:uncharacterized protein LOC131011143 [Salvia miltiorrhiza]